MMWKNMAEPNRLGWQYNTAHVICMLDT